MADRTWQMSKEFFARKPDEVFPDVESLHDFNTRKMQMTRQETTNLAELTAIVEEGEVFLQTPKGKRLDMTNYAYEKLLTTIGASKTWFDKLDADMIARNLNYGFKACVPNSVDPRDAKPWQLDESGRVIDTNAKLITVENGHSELIHVTGARYNLIFDAQLSELALQLQEKYGLLPAPANPRKDVVHRGLYASDRDCFIFLSNCDKEVLQFAENPIYRGIMLWNGYDRTFGMSIFLFNGICSNYSIHGFTEKFSVEGRHTAKLFEKVNFATLSDSLKDAFNAGSKTEQKFLEYATKTELGSNQEETIDELLKLRQLLLGKKTCEKVYEMAVERENIYGNPRSVWALGNVITEIGRDKPFADARRGYMQAAKAVFDIAEAQVV